MQTKIQSPALQSQRTEALSSMHGWAKWVFLMMLGSAFGRTFYYLGFPPAKIFMGEIVLVLFFLLRPREFSDRWAIYLTRPGVFGPFAWCLLLSVLYGIFEVFYGLLSGYPLLTALQNLVFNIYPVYFFLGLWIGTEYPAMLQKVVRWWAWMLVFYGPAYLLFLHRINVTIPGTDGIPLFSQPGGGGIIILLLLALERKPLRFGLPMVVAAAMMLAVQVRAEWLGTVAAFLVWGVLDRKMTKVLLTGFLAVVLLAIGFVADVNLPSPAERGGNISSREIVARGLSAFDSDLAQEYTQSRQIRFYAGTVSWRVSWWGRIWDSVNESWTKTFIGNGYGFPLGSLVPYLRTNEIRTPHNIFFFALGYSGWIGVVLFFSLQAALCRILWRVYRLTGRSYGLAIWIASLITALFGNFFETPWGAIPYYLMIGLAIGPVLGFKFASAVELAPNRPNIEVMVPQRVYTRLSLRAPLT